MENDTEKLKQDINNELNKMSPIGELFDSIQYSNYDDLDRFISNLNYDQALYCVIEAVKSAYTRGAFRLEESEAISKSIRVITNK
jgi:hypothetical protein